jgi:RHO1 GDP-GTP exchange protein 1/2
LSDELSNLTCVIFSVPSRASETNSSVPRLDTHECIRRFQAHQLSPSDEAWHKLVPLEAREVLDKQEIVRQSALFELIQAERNYVYDLELTQEVFVEPLIATSPIPQARIQGFVLEVFYNFKEILAYHRRMLDALFARQKEQHPLIQSVSDIILDCERSVFDLYEGQSNLAHHS